MTDLSETMSLDAQKATPRPNLKSLCDKYKLAYGYMEDYVKKVKEEAGKVIRRKKDWTKEDKKDILSKACIRAAASLKLHTENGLGYKRPEARAIAYFVACQEFGLHVKLQDLINDEKNTQKSKQEDIKEEMRNISYRDKFVAQARPRKNQNVFDGVKQFFANPLQKKRDR